MSMWYENENSMGIMKKKYLHEGEKPEEFIPRVASIFDGELHEQAIEVLNNADFLPAGRTLFGAGYKGTRKVSLSNCFLAGTKVITTNGIKNIEDIKVNDEVYTSKGPKRVNKTLKRRYIGDLYKLSSSDFTNDIICTPNHQFLTPDGWVRADRFFGFKMIDCNLKKPMMIKKVLSDDYAGVENVEVLENRDVVVYNLSVDEVHEYNVNGVIAHNCYICPTPRDDIESIFDTAKMIARISSYGGGCGLAIDNLRPKDAPVNNSAMKSTGAVSFLNIFDATGSTIGQNGRRAALMVCLRCDHPDIEEFLNIKNEGNKLPSMNISIKFTNKFMEAIKDNKEFRLYFDSPETGLIEKYINAREFFHRFCISNWRWGDPGIMFIDRIRSFHLLSGYPDSEYRIDTSNPCLAGYTRILTDKGYFPIESLVDQEVNIWNGYRYSKVKPFITGYNQQMVRVSFSNGAFIDCTTYHKFIMSDGSRKEAKDLLINDTLARWNYIPIEGPNNADRRIMYTHGFFSGDGSITNSNTPEIVVYDDDKKREIPILNYDRILEQTNTNKAGGIRSVVILKEDGLIPYDKNWVPDCSFSIDSRIWWLAGLIDSDGTMNTNAGDICISSINYDFLHNVQLMLSTLGVFSKIGIGRMAGRRLLPANDGTGQLKEYECHTCYRLTLATSSVLQLSRLGLITFRVRLQSVNTNPYKKPVKVVDVSPIGVAPTVYCLTEPYNNSLVAEGILAGQCSEYLGSGGNSCNLGSINLYNIIDDKFTDHAHVNIEKLKHITDIGIRMLDSILDYGYDMQPLDINRECIRDWRPIGLGVFGLADALVALCIRYGSEESRHVVSEIMDTIMKQAITTSSLLAKEKGSFDKFNLDYVMKSPLIQMYSELHDMIRKNGLRNGSLLSIAPTGTISIFAGGFTGGVEPMFKLAYTRASHNMEEKGQTFTIYSRGVADLLKFHNMEGISTEEAKKRFPFLVESHEVPYIERVQLQSVMQDYVDNAISSTVNLPNSATVEDIEKIYMEAWQAGLKGITVFRDGCERGNILGVEDTKKKDDVEYDSIDPATRRGVKKIDGTTVRECTSCVKSLYVTVNKLENGKAFEVFTNASGGCKTNINTISRLISLSLRSGVKASRIIDELRANQCPACQLLRRQGKEEIALSCSNAIADAIELALEVEDKKEEDDAVIKRPCPSCGKHTLIPEGKCVTCSNCGWSKCE